MTTTRFIETMQAAGLNPPTNIEPGKLHRFGKNRTCYAKVFPDGQGGVFGDWKTGLKGQWQAEKSKPMSKSEWEGFAKKIKAEEAARQREMARRHEAGAIRAKAIMGTAKGDPYTHPYTVLKGGLPFGEFVRRGAWPQRGWADALLIPLFEKTGRVMNISAIPGNLQGRKDLLQGARKQGCFYPLGKIRGAAVVLVGEGLASVAAGVASTGLPGVVGVDAGNLPAVARVVRELAPAANIIILADDDRHPDGQHNVGILAARAAAVAAGGVVAYPDMGRKADFWDLWKEAGPEAVRAAIIKTGVAI